jgi:N-acetylglucosamine-6-phosphate deacetylase
MPGSQVTLPAGYRLVHARVRFRWSRFVHVTARSTAVKVTLCGRVSPGRDADLTGLHHDPATGAYWYMLGPHTLCPRCAARVGS